MGATTDVDRLMIPEGANRADPRTLCAVLAGVPDKRKRRGKRYTVAWVLTLLLLAKMSGERGLSGIGIGTFTYPLESFSPEQSIVPYFIAFAAEFATSSPRWDDFYAHTVDNTDLLRIRPYVWPLVRCSSSSNYKIFHFHPLPEPIHHWHWRSQEYHTTEISVTIDWRHADFGSSRVIFAQEYCWCRRCLIPTVIAWICASHGSCSDLSPLSIITTSCNFSSYNS